MAVSEDAMRLLDEASAAHSLVHCSAVRRHTGAVGSGLLLVRGLGGQRERR